MPITNQVTNLRNTPGMLADTLANQPAAGFAGQLFVSTDSPYGIYRDTGSAWVLVASGSGGSTPTLQNVTTAGSVTTTTITAASFITTGGTSAQFTKGDGSLDSTVYLPKANPAYTGSLTTGTQTFTPSNALISIQSSVNSYNQVVLTNTSSGASASSDFIVGNNNSTDTTYYGDFGMNSSGFVGTGNFNIANGIYLYSYSADLAIGTFTNNAIHFIVNNGAADALTINTAGQLSTPNQITALKYIVSGAASTQFLKGDGSLDGSTYLAAGSAVSTFSAGTTGFTPFTATSGAVVLSGTLNVANGGTGTTSLATLAANSAFSSLYQGLNTNLTSLSGLTYASLSFVKMSAAGTFSLDTNTYLTAGSAVTSFSAGTTGFTPSTATSGAITLSGILNVSNGGTGYSSLTSLAGNTAFTSVYVPYTGATTSVNIGSNSFTGGAASFTTGTFSGSITGQGANQYFGTNGQDNTINLYGYNSSTSLISSNAGVSFTYNGVRIVSNSNNANSLPAWSIDLGGNVNTTIISDAFTVGRKASGGSWNTFLSVLNNGKLLVGTTSSPSSTAIKAVINDTSNAGGLQLTSANNGGIAFIPSTSGGVNIYTHTGAVGSETYTSALTINSSQIITTASRLNVNNAADSSSYQLNVAGNSQILNTNALVVNTSYFTEIITNSLTGSTATTNSTEVLMGASVDALGIATTGANTQITATLVAATISRVYVNSSGGSFTKASAWAGNMEFAGAIAVTDASCLYTGVPYQQSGQTAYSGTITNFYGLLIEDISGNTNIGSKITNKYGIYQRGASDINFFNGAIQLGTGNSLTASVLSTVTNKIKIIVNGTTLYILASTSST